MTALDTLMRVRGRVVPGDGRGRVLGFPTANLQLARHEVPQDGVYVAIATVEGIEGEFDATVSVGTNPTFGGERAPRVEVYLHDVTIDLYGQIMAVEILDLLRTTVAFATVDKLIAQTERDVETSRGVHAARRGR
ncbi:riboflavin kinase [Microbacterium sp. YY-03]|uniref:riboflavin kinase n=1 Tax=Microbacterium sp. YY-03 TaxID=3421636 RepID=UPI003D16BB15